MADPEQIAAAYQITFAPGSAGELVLDDLGAMGGVLVSCHEPGDPYTSAYREGRRSLVLDILTRLSWTMTDMVQMRMRVSAERQREMDAMMEGEDLL